MDNNEETVVETTTVDTSFRHQLGKSIVGSLAAFAANRVAEKGYDKALQLYRSRRSA